MQLPDSITVYNYCGENDGGEAVYQRTYIDSVLIRLEKGVRQNPTQQLIGKNSTAVYIFPSQSSASSTYVDEYEFDLVRDKSAVYTLRTNGKDRICKGYINDSQPPSSAVTMRLLDVEDNRVGDLPVSHWKVTCS